MVQPQNIIGIIGAVIIIATFILETTNKLSRDHRTYILLFLTGSIFLAIYSTIINQPIFIVLNIAAVLIGIYELVITKRHTRVKTQ
jgi:hypothetical protein